MFIKNLIVFLKQSFFFFFVPMLTDDFINYIANEKRYSTNTLVAYKNDLLLFSEFLVSEFEISKPEDATQEMIRSWMVNMINNGMSGTTINRKISSLSSYYTYLVRMQVVSKNPTKQIASVKTPSRLPLYFDKDQLVDYLNTDTDTNSFVKLRDKIVIEILYSTGIRSSELLTLKISDIDIGNNSIKVLGKRNKQRIIPLSNKQVSSITNYIQEMEKQFGYINDYLIVTNKGVRAYPKLIYRIVNKELSALAGEVKSPHVLRHSFATHMLNNGADLNIIKEILGHANLTATQIYTHNSIKQLIKVYMQAHPRAKLNTGG